MHRLYDSGRVDAAVCPVLYRCVRCYKVPTDQLVRVWECVTPVWLSMNIRCEDAVVFSVRMYEFRYVVMWMLMILVRGVHIG